MRKHALLAPSAASRWMTCTPSARLEEKLPETESDYAAEGTLAHDLALNELNYALSYINYTEYLFVRKNIQANPLFKQEMVYYVNAYKDYVLDKLENLRKRYKRVQIFLEHKFVNNEYVADWFGHIDCVIIADKHLCVIDFKYGKGIAVDAEQNKQLLCYAFIAFLELGFLFDVINVEMCIHQPRLDSITEWETTLEHLTHWANSELRPKARLATAGAGEYVPGEHCRFCKVKPRCKALRDHNMSLVKWDAELPELIPDEDIAAILQRAEVFINWINSVKDYALHEAVNSGKKFPGMKLVTGRSNRIITNEDKVAHILRSGGYKGYYELKMQSLTKLEQLVGKTKLQQLIGKYIIKPQGSPVLVPVSDKRPGIGTASGAADAFKNLTNGKTEIKQKQNRKGRS